jgi:transcriptional/translational regulatory protein YebC/TACO1
MEAAIARGQGKSTTGAALESVTLEVIMPPTVAMVIDAETDNKSRTLMELRIAVKNHKGTVTPTAYLFQRKGRLQFEKDDRNLGVDQVLDDAIEAGAEDVKMDEDGRIVVWTEPNKVTAAAKALQESLGLKVESSDIIWDANEDTRVPLESESSAKVLSDFVTAIQDNPNVQGVYSNAAQGTLTDELWEDFAGRLDA